MRIRVQIHTPKGSIEPPCIADPRRACSSASTPSQPTHRVDADSDSREYIPSENTFRRPICRFTVSRTPPFRFMSFHLCFRVVPVCVSSFPVGSFGERVPRSGLVERSAPSSVARVCRLTPLCTRTTLCRLSLLHHRRRWVSLTYHAGSRWHALTHRPGAATHAASTGSLSLESRWRPVQSRCEAKRRKRAGRGPKLLIPQRSGIPLSAKRRRQIPYARGGDGAQLELRSRGAHVTREPTNVTHSHVSLTSHRSP